LDDRPGDTSEKRKYLLAWDSNQYLASATQILRVTSSYGYYTRPQVYKEIGYSGPVEPNLPPWYNPGPGEVVERSTIAAGIVKRGTQ
jgi:hypothetical protein